MIYTTSVSISPDICNCYGTIIFGGALMSHMDLAAAHCVRKVLKKSRTASSAVTHKVLDLEFHAPSYLGQTLDFTARLKNLGKKSIIVNVVVYRDNTLIASADFVFISVQEIVSPFNPSNKLPYTDHNLVYEEGEIIDIS